jgi:hypothetical protein
VTRAQEFHDRADHFAVRAVHARDRKARNTNLSLEQSYRDLAAQQEQSSAAGGDPDAPDPDPSDSRAP